MESIFNKDIKTIEKKEKAIKKPIKKSKSLLFKN